MQVRSASTDTPAEQALPVAPTVPAVLDSAAAAGAAKKPAPFDALKLEPSATVAARAAKKEQKRLAAVAAALPFGTAPAARAGNAARKAAVEADWVENTNGDST
jgi:hypothetical protein